MLAGAIDTISEACLAIHSRRLEAGQDAGRDSVKTHGMVVRAGLNALRALYGFRARSDAETIGRKSHKKNDVMLLLRQIAAFDWSENRDIRFTADELIIWLCEVE